MTRRGPMGALLLVVAVGIDCGGTGPPFPSPLPVSQTLAVRTNDGRSLGTAVVKMAPGESFALSLQTLNDAGVSTPSVHSRFFAVRETETAGTVGAFIARSTDGIASVVPDGRPWVVWLMSSVSGADYAAAAASPGFLEQAISRRVSTVSRLTPTNNVNPLLFVVDGDTTPIEDALELLNSTFIVGGVELARLEWIGDAPAGWLRAGLGTSVFGDTLGGVHAGQFFLVNPRNPPAFQRIVAIEEAAETFLEFDDLFGENTILALAGSTSTFDITPSGRDYLTFALLLRR